MLTDDKIKKLEEKGFNRWTKNGMDRLYINAGALGLVCTYHKTGTICTAHFNGERVSNSEGRRMKASKTFIDVATGILYSDNSYLKSAAEEIVAGI